MSRAATRILVGAMLLAAGALAPPVAAHGTFLDVRPLPGVEVGGMIDEVAFLFPEDVLIEGASVVVTDPHGAIVPQQGALAHPIPAVVRMALEPLTEPGIHRVDYSIPATDGFTFAGEFTFAYAPAADPVEPLPFGRDSRIPVGAVIAVVVLVLAAGGVATRSVRRRLDGSSAR